MLLSRIYTKAYKSIYELSFPVNDSISVLIGANESGKSNLLHAIDSFNYGSLFDNSLTCQYSDYYYQGRCPEIALDFNELSEEDREKLTPYSSVFGDVQEFTIKRSGPKIKDYHLIVDENEIKVDDMKGVLDSLPNILYFDTLPLLKDQVTMDDLLSTSEKYVTERNLLKIGGIPDFEILFEDSTRGRRASEEASRAITDQIRRTWSQEPSIEIKLNVNGKVLYIDLADSTTVFDTPCSRSLGFRWYLSFYINFIAQTFEANSNDYIFLIDEPGIHLHPAGQKDLVKVFEDLGQRNQVIFTTHSPFMINRLHPERVRLVSKDKDGTRVDSEAYRQDWRPLRNSIGLMIGDLFFFDNSGVIVEMPNVRSGLLDQVSKFKFWQKNKIDEE